MDPVTLTLLAAGIAGSAVAAGLALQKSSMFKLWRVKKVAINDAKDGDHVRVGGFVEAVVELLEAPYSKTECVAHETVIERKEQFKSNAKWVTILKHSLSVDFVLRGDNGEKVYVDGLLIEPIFKVRTRANTGMVMQDSRLLDHLRERGLATQGMFFKKPIRLQERTLMVGDYAQVAGVASWEADPDAPQNMEGYRGSAHQKRLRITGFEGGPVLAWNRFGAPDKS